MGDDAGDGRALALAAAAATHSNSPAATHAALCRCHARILASLSGSLAAPQIHESLRSRSMVGSVRIAPSAVAFATNQSKVDSFAVAPGKYDSAAFSQPRTSAVSSGGPALSPRQA